MGRIFISDDRGAVVSDWVVLSAAIATFGLVITYLVMHDSAGYLMAEFDDMNQQYASDSGAVASLADGAGDSAKYTANQ